MTGEALLAPWLRELEFTDVIAPEPPQELPWSQPYTAIKTWLRGELVEDVRIEVVAFGNEYLVATAARGAGIGAASRALGGGLGVGNIDPWQALEKVDIEKDIAPCARGSCGCSKP